MEMNLTALVVNATKIKNKPNISLLPLSMFHTAARISRSYR